MRKIALSLGAALLASGMATSVSAYENGKSALNQLDAGQGRFQLLKTISRTAESVDFASMSAALTGSSANTMAGLLEKWKSSESESDSHGRNDTDDALAHVLGSRSLGEQAREMFHKDRGDIASMYERDRSNARKHFAKNHVVPVPEPEVYALMLGGVGLVGAMARRRQRKSAK